MRKKIVIANWKMNGLSKQVESFAKEFSNCRMTDVDIVICPPSPVLSLCSSKFVNTGIKTGSQDCHDSQKGAFTGDVSAEMLKDAGASYVIVGHSERRDRYKESSLLVSLKVLAAWAVGLKAIVCVGETEFQRCSGKTKRIVKKQLLQSIPDEVSHENLLIAYEPVWAIGTGAIPKVNEIKIVHSRVRKFLCKRFGNDQGQMIPIVYGGSMNANNANNILGIENVDGGLVGGASLNSVEFKKIISIAQNKANPPHNI